MSLTLLQRNAVETIAACLQGDTAELFHALIDELTSSSKVVRNDTPAMARIREKFGAMTELVVRLKCEHRNLLPAQLLTVLHHELPAPDLTGVGVLLVDAWRDLNEVTKEIA